MCFLGTIPVETLVGGGTLKMLELVALCHARHRQEADGEEATKSIYVFPFHNYDNLNDN